MNITPKKFYYKDTVLTSWRTWSVVSVLMGALLRMVSATAHGFDFDETFTGVYSYKNPSKLFNDLAAKDSHPPLDYLLRSPFVHLGASELQLRIISVMFSLAGLAIFGFWMSRALPNWKGALATFIMAISPFQIIYARENRMYALSALCGVVAIWSAWEWLKTSHHKWTVLVGVTLAVSLFNHSSGMFLVGAVFWTPLLRKDKAAWHWRAACVFSVGVWAVIWGPYFVQQMNRNSGSWIPHTSLSKIPETIGGLFVQSERGYVVAFIMVICGVVALRHTDRLLLRLTLTGAVMPICVGAFSGLYLRVFISRTFAPFAWVIPLGLAVLITSLWEKRQVVGIAALILIGSSIPPSLSLAVYPNEPAEHLAVSAALKKSSPGDIIALHPHWLFPVLQWESRGLGFDFVNDEIEDSYAAKSPGKRTGRTWLVHPDTYAPDITDFKVCGRTTFENYKLTCLDSTAKE